MSNQGFRNPSCHNPAKEHVPMVAIPYDVFLDVMAIEIKEEEPAAMLGKARENTVSKKKKKQAKLSMEVRSKSKLSVENEMKSMGVMGGGGKARSH